MVADTGPIGLDGYAPRSAPRGDRFERGVRTGIREQPCALADHDGIGEQVELVDQAVGEQPSDEDTAAGHQQFAVLLRLQITDGRGDVAGQDTRARPPRVGEAGRNPGGRLGWCLIKPRRRNGSNFSGFAPQGCPLRAGLSVLPTGGARHHAQKRGDR
jgi:hypothetical protein